MNTWNVMDAVKGGLILAGILLITSTVMADESDVIADRLDDRGDRVEERLDRSGDRIDHRLDKRGDRIDAQFRKHHSNTMLPKLRVDVCGRGGGLCQSHCLSFCGVASACQITVLQANLTIIEIRTDPLSTARRAARCTDRHRK